VDCSGSHSGSEEAGPIMTLRKRPRDPAQLCVSIKRPRLRHGALCRPVQARFIGPLGGVSEMIGCKGPAFGSLEYSASIASLSHIRAMSIRMD
jgi:hypothetical protein